MIIAHEDLERTTRFLLAGRTVLDMPESKEMTEQIDRQAKQPLQAACVSEDLKC